MSKSKSITSIPTPQNQEVNNFQNLKEKAKKRVRNKSDGQFIIKFENGLTNEFIRNGIGGKLNVEEIEHNGRERYGENTKEYMMKPKY